MLYVAISELNDKQVHIFSITDELKEDEYINLLLEEGKIVLHTESLMSFLSHAEENGHIDLNDKPNEEFKHSIQIGDKVFGIPPSIWNQTSKSATILTDSLFLPPEPISDEKGIVNLENFYLSQALSQFGMDITKGILLQGTLKKSYIG